MLNVKQHQLGALPYMDNIHGYTWIYKRVQLIYQSKVLSGQVRKILYPLKTYTIYRKLKYNIQ